jgi:predicted permease
MLTIKSAVRTLLKHRGFTVVAVLTIAIGIGANTALFSVYDQLVLNPVTIPEPASLVTIASRNAQNQVVPNVSWLRYEEIRARATSFASTGISAFETFTLTGVGEPEQLTALRVDATFLPTLGLGVARGRNFLAEEDVPNGPAVCILTHEMWQTRFGGRETIVGETITLNGQPWQVVGVMPPRLSVPFSQVQLFAPRVFEVTGLTSAQVQIGSLYAQPIARLKSGVTLERALDELKTIGASYRERFGGKLDANIPNEIQPFVQSIVGSLQPTFYTLLAAVGFVLLIACANVASLFLGRLTVRQKEIAVRQSLGASRRAVMLQFLTESLVFSVAAGVVGVILAVWAIAGIQSLVGAQLPPNQTLTLNPRALLFTAGASIVSALLVGLAPAWQASRAQIVDMLKDAARGSTRRSGRFRSQLIVAEVALSVVLLIGSGLLLISFLRLRSTSPGFDASGSAAAVVSLPITRYNTPAQQTDFFERVVGALESRPGVIEAAAVMGLPLTGFTPRSPYGVAGRPVVALTDRPLAGLAVVSEDYFRLMRIPFVEGRAFTADDRAGSPGVCIINESLARRLFAGESALGKILLRGRNFEIQDQIVGVIHDVKTLGINVPVQDEIYHPLRQLPRATLAVVVRADGDPAVLRAVLNEAVRSVDKDQPTTGFATLENNVAASLGTQRVVASLTAIFAAVALALSAIGLYSVLAHAVSERSAEIGIRMALGAARPQVVGLIMRSGLTLVGIGLGRGVAGATVAALACLMPSLRASRIDPLIALQNL